MGGVREKWREGKRYCSRNIVVSSSPTAMGAGEVYTHTFAHTHIFHLNNRQMQKCKEKNLKEVTLSPQLDRVHASPPSEAVILANLLRGEEWRRRGKQ